MLDMQLNEPVKKLKQKISRKYRKQVGYCPAMLHEILSILTGPDMITDLKLLLEFTELDMSYPDSSKEWSTASQESKHTLDPCSSGPMSDFFCTRSKGHEGRHYAFDSSDSLCAVWK